jgi:hypothetical protein
VIESAKRHNAESASVKDWRIRNNSNRKMREIARALSAGKGYEIGTAAEIGAKYGIKFLWEGSDTRKFIWAVIVGINPMALHPSKSTRLLLAPIGGIGPGFMYFK